MTNVIKIPTGYLFTDTYSKGQLETLSIGDYGKEKNIKADFLGFNKPINSVQNGDCKPLSEKWVITLSTQYGCVMKCNFCDAKNVKFNGNATFDDLKQQFSSAIKLFGDVKYTDRLNLHFARMGEPIFNDNVFDFTKWLYTKKPEWNEELGLRVEVIHPVLTTSMPKALNKSILIRKLDRWCYFKNHIYNGQAGLQLSINSTDDEQRNFLFGGSSYSLIDISNICKELIKPVGRKYCLNFAVSDNTVIDGNKLKSLFDPDMFMVKITPYHNSNSCVSSGITTKDGYISYSPYIKFEEELKNYGFDVIVFVPSMDEENGLVTCGNAILGGGIIKC